MENVNKEDVPTIWYFYALVLMWLVVLTIQIVDLPTKLKVKSDAKSEEYQVIGVVRPIKNDPYIVMPIYVATKDMRSWYLMRHADKMINEYRGIVQLSKGEEHAVPQTAVQD